MTQHSGHQAVEDVQKLDLSGLDLTDVGLLAHMPQLVQLKLNDNNVNTLEPISYLHQLNELQMERNDITNLNDVAFLAHLKHIHVLRLNENPITHQPRYRESVASTLPSLRKLDNRDVSDAERSAESLSCAQQFSSTHAPSHTGATKNADADANGASPREHNGDAVAPNGHDLNVRMQPFDRGITGKRKRNDEGEAHDHDDETDIADRTKKMQRLSNLLVVNKESRDEFERLKCKCEEEQVYVKRQLSLLQQKRNRMFPKERAVADNAITVMLQRINQLGEAVKQYHCDIETLDFVLQRMQTTAE